MTMIPPAEPIPSTEVEPEDIDVIGTAFAILKRFESDPEFNAAARRIWNDVERDLEAAGRAALHIASDETMREQFWEGMLRIATGEADE